MPSRRAGIKMEETEKTIEENNAKNISKTSDIKKIVAAQNLEKRFPLKAGGLSTTEYYIHALNSVSFNVYENSTLGIVGESGCGKTTLARTLLRIYEPDNGKIFFNLPQDRMEAQNEEDNFLNFKGKKLKTERSAMQYIFQDPYTALNPKMQVNEIITEPLQASGEKLKESERKKLALKLLDMVGIPSSSASKFPHEFSGGQRQRISIARSISANPKLIICDEPVSSLDVSIQSQILNLLIQLQRETGVSYLFIAHNLAIVFYMSDFVAVMYAGKIVEYAPSKELYKNPLHPYTLLLRSVVPEIGKPKNIFEKQKNQQGADAVVSDEAGIKGRITSAKKNSGASNEPLAEIEQSCLFYNRCPIRKEICKNCAPQLLPVTADSAQLGDCSGELRSSKFTQLSGQNCANSSGDILHSAEQNSFDYSKVHLCACHSV